MRDKRSEIVLHSVSGGPAELMAEVPPETVAQLEGWLSDKQTLVYTIRIPGGGSRGIWSVTPGGKPKLLIDPPASNATVSRDGHWIAYASNRSGRLEVFVEPLPGDRDKRQITVDGGDNPLWSADGHELFFLTLQQRPLTAVQMANGFPMSKPLPLPISRIVSPGPRPYDVSSDGKQFLVMLQGGTDNDLVSADQITVTLNWFQELKSRVPAN